MATRIWRLLRSSRAQAIVLCSILVAACGGGGSDGPSELPTPAPTLTLTASAATVAQGDTVTLTWTTTNATSCTASQGWSGTKPTSGSESTGPLNSTTTFELTCTGPGGSVSRSTTVTVVPPPTVTIDTSATSVPAPGTVTLSWSSTNATSCSASDGWTGQRATSGSEEITPLLATTTFTLTCTGIGGTSAPQSTTVTVTPPAGGNVIVTGRIQFERIPYETTLGNGLDPDNLVLSPARGVVVDAIPAESSNPPPPPLATTTTNKEGVYAVAVPPNTNIFIRARAQMVKSGSAPTWEFSVRNNTNGNALYVLDGTEFNTGSGVTRDLTAGSGWGGTTYTDVRAAAPFAILDTVYQAKELIHAVSSVSLPPLNLYWSPSNRPATPICAQLGNISTTFYLSGNFTDSCGPLPEGIYILGDFSIGDTDEFDQHVIAHEFGHYLEDKLSRSDSIGGSHGAGDRLDLRVAFGEGWGNAFSAMAMNDPVYRDSFDRVARDFNFSLELDTGTAEGWYSEASVGEILWDLFDPANESGDSIELGFGPILDAMRNGQRTTSALTSIFSFLEALRDEVPAQSSAINQLRNGEQISSTDAFGSGETNSGGDTLNLPVYRSVTLGAPQQAFCVRVPSGADIDNKLGFSRFFRLDLTTARTVTIRVVGTVDPATPNSAAAQDPDVWVYKEGLTVAAGQQLGQTEQLSQISLSAGTYIIEVYDFDLVAGSTPRCMTITVTGT